MGFSLFFLLISLVCGAQTVSLEGAICKIRHEECDSSGNVITRNNRRTLPGKMTMADRAAEAKRPHDEDLVFNGRFISDRRPPRPSNFDSWSLYPLEAGTGYGPAGGPGYGPGMGDVAISSGVGVRHPFGGMAVETGIGVGLGGSGRSGGIPFGFGNGYGATGQGRYWNPRFEG